MPELTFGRIEGSDKTFDALRMLEYGSVKLSSRCIRLTDICFYCFAGLVVRCPALMRTPHESVAQSTGLAQCLRCVVICANVNSTHFKDSNIICMIIFVALTWKRIAVTPSTLNSMRTPYTELAPVSVPSPRLTLQLCDAALRLVNVFFLICFCCASFDFNSLLKLYHIIVVNAHFQSHLM